MSRHPKLTPEVTKRLLEAFRVGATHRIACDYAGISPQTMYNWIEKGQAGREPYIAFVEQLKTSEGTAAVGWLAKIEKAASDGNWQAAAWKLERRYPQEYGRTVQEHHIKLDWERLSESQLRRLAAGEPPEQVLTDTPGDPQG